MRGTDPRQEGMFSYVSPEGRVPGDHPLRALRKMVNTALEGLTQEFEAMYSHTGRPSIAPEQLLRALLLQIGALTPLAAAGIVGHGSGLGPCVPARDRR